MATYKEAGVDINKGNDFIEKIGGLVKKTHRKEVLSSLSNFSGLFSLKGYKEPVLVSSTDGVGTKLLIAELLNKYDSVGIDLVAMSVDDVLTMGAEPLFFLDYIASGRIDITQGEQIIRGIVKGCREANCALLGGETAEMPQFYDEGQYELVGFAVGVVERGNIIDGSQIRPGDKILGFPSSGLHSNGYSLVRKILFKNVAKKKEQIKILTEKDKVLKKCWGEELLTPTRIYVKSILSLIKKGIKITGISHITGGGLKDNINRLLPKGCRADIFPGWPVPPVFTRLQELGNIDKEEIYKVFNMGIGMVIIVRPTEEKRIFDYLKSNKEVIFSIGSITRGKKEVVIKN